MAMIQRMKISTRRKQSRRSSILRRRRRIHGKEEIVNREHPCRMQLYFKGLLMMMTTMTGMTMMTIMFYEDQ